ncbi:hypothetical protein AVEN_105407-1, partial [Araneus ventricosus]
TWSTDLEKEAEVYSPEVTKRPGFAGIVPNLEGKHASQIYRRMKEVCGEQCLTRCTTFRWCQRYEAGQVNIKDLPRPGQAHVVTNSATISAVDEIIRHNR